MKRIFIILLSFTLLLSICACGNEGKDSDGGVVGQWDLDLSLLDYEPDECTQTKWMFDELTETREDGTKYGYAYCVFYDGSIDDSYDYYTYHVNNNNDIAIRGYYSDGSYSVEDVLEIEIVNGKRALVSKVYVEVYYYSGDGKDYLEQISQDKDVDKNVLGQWDRDFSIVDHEPEDYDTDMWVFDKPTEKHDNGKMYGYVYCIRYDGVIEISSYDYYSYCINADNTITIMTNWANGGGWSSDVYDTLKIKIINGKRALVSKKHENEVYYYSGDGKDILDLFDEE